MIWTCEHLYSFPDLFPIILYANRALHLSSFDDDDDEVPLAKRAKFVSGKAASAKESNPSPAKSTPPSRTGVEKIPVSRVIPPGDAPTPSAGRDHVSIYFALFLPNSPHVD
jgi:hypothetical protein